VGGNLWPSAIKHALDGRLDQSAVSAVQQWAFKPAQKNGKAVRVAAHIEVNFRLK
jgi:TonB family protein